MVLANLLSWLSPPQRPTAAVSRPRRFRPECEALEDRWVPTAIRNLPGITTTFPVGGVGLTQVTPGGRTDDGSSDQVALGFTINFYGVSTSTTFINNNGNITLDSPNSSFVPMGISQNVDQPMIAPFFADVDTTNPNSGVCTYGQANICGFQCFVVNWVNVAPFPALPGPFDSFQLILINRSDTGAGNFDMEMNYGSMKWDTAESQGGIPAEAGFTNGIAGAGRVSYEFPGSLTPGALLDGGPNALMTNSLAATTPGRYHFLVRNGVVQSMAGMQDITNQVSVFHPLRYAYNPATHLNTGNLTVFSGTGAAATCLDETGANGQFGPITVVFQQLPPGVSVANASGTTASGRAYITAPNSTLVNGHAVRFRIQLRNPNHVHLSTYFEGYSVRVFSGPFDPSQA